MQYFCSFHRYPSFPSPLHQPSITIIDLHLLDTRALPLIRLALHVQNLR